jgi:hypothetical protein
MSSPVTEPSLPSGATWNWQDRDVLRLNVGIKISGGDIRGLVDEVISVLDRVPECVGILVNAEVSSVPVDKLIGLLRKVRAHRHTRVIAIVVPRGDRSMWYAPPASLGLFRQENDALAWLSSRVK